MNETPIRMRRGELGITQQAVADAAGIAWSYYQRLEAGKQVPSVDIAQRVAKALDSSVNDLWPLKEAS